MRQRLTDLLKVVLTLGISMTVITLMYIYEGKAGASPLKDTAPKDTVLSRFEFYDKPAKDGLKEAMDFYGIHHQDIVYAQAILETGNFTSNLCRRHNNLFGLYCSKSKRYCRFDHWTESVIAYKERIQRRYKPPNDYYTFLEKIGYASDPSYTAKLKQIVRNEKRRDTGEGN